MNDRKRAEIRTVMAAENPHDSNVRESRVAVGRQIGDAHVIDEFAAGEHPAYYLAHDLIRLARHVGRSADGA